MDQSQLPNDKPKGCGCGGNTNAKVNYNHKPPLTEQQEDLISRIQKVNQQKKSIYKKSTRYFM